MRTWDLIPTWGAIPMTAKKTIYCPTNDFSCPYCGTYGECNLDNPAEECDDYYYAVGDEEE